MRKFLLNKNTEILSILTMIFLFFIIRKGSERYVVDYVLMGVTIFFCLYKKKYNKIPMGLVISIIGYTFFITLSFFKNDFISLNIELFFKIVIHNYILFLCLTQLELSEKYYNGFLFFFILCSLIVTIKGLEEWHLNNFSPYYRVKMRTEPTILTIEIGIYVLMSFFSLLYSKKIIVKIISGIIFVLSFLVLISTNSRITLLVIPLIIATTLLIKFKIRFKYFIIFFVLGICFIKEPHVNKYLYRVKQLTSMENIEKETRIKIWLKGIKDFKENKYRPLGFYYYKNYELGAISWEKNPHLHNNFLEIMITQGIGAIIFYISFNIFLLLEFIKKLKASQIESQKILIYFSISVLVFLNLTGLTDCNIYFSKVNQLAFFMFALALCKVRGENTNE